MGNRWQGWAALTIALIYGLSFLSLFEQFGQYAYLYAFIPVLAFAFFCGPWCALVSVLGAFFLHALLLIHVQGVSFMEFANTSFFFLHSLLLFTGFIIGLLYSQNQRIRRLSTQCRDVLLDRCEVCIGT